MFFWILASALALLVATLFALAFLRERGAAEHPAAYDMRVYRAQLSEVERDLARGVLSEDDAERTRAEVSRRLLAADAQLEAAQSRSDQPRTLTLAMVALSGLALLAGSLGLYAQLGAPGTSDLPHAARLAAATEGYKTRPTQAAFTADLVRQTQPAPEPQYAELMERLRKSVAERPDELQGQILLAQNEARLGNFRAALSAQDAVIRLKGDKATANDHVARAQILISEARGYISPEAETAIRDAIMLDEKAPTARYFLGLLWLQNDRADRAFAIWRKLLAEGPESAPWNRAIASQIEDVAWLAGVPYTPPKPATGPSAEDTAAASEMSGEERAEMIRGMVEQLNERLATEGGTPEEWARLISALGVLGQTDRARAIWSEAQTRFAENAEALETVRMGARSAGVNE